MRHSIVARSGASYGAQFGAIYADNGAIIEIAHSILQHNLETLTYASVKAVDSTLTITNSTLETTAYGIWVRDCTVNISHNNIQNNVLYGMYNAGSTTVNVPDNWWGAVNGPAPHGSGNAINVPNVYVIPWSPAPLSIE